MDKLNFAELDDYLNSCNNSKIIHQIWFGIIPNKREAAKQYKKLEKYRNTWLLKNPDWIYKCWDAKECLNVVKTFYPEHLDMYKSYKYEIQRCDAVRYFILHRYGGLYADMDYCCVKPWSDVINEYKGDIYFVETPNKINEQLHVSNSLMYSKKDNLFWKSIFIELEKYKNLPIYYGRHLTIMYSTGPCIINRVFNRCKNKFKLKHYPFKFFHPYGLSNNIEINDNKSNLYAYHLGKGSWEQQDTKILIFLYLEYKILLLIIIILLIPLLLRLIKT